MGSSLDMRRDPIGKSCTTRTLLDYLIFLRCAVQPRHDAARARSIGVKLAFRMAIFKGLLGLADVARLAPPIEGNGARTYYEPKANMMLWRGWGFRRRCSGSARRCGPCSQPCESSPRCCYPKASFWIEQVCSARVVMMACVVMLIASARWARRS